MCSFYKCILWIIIIESINYVEPLENTDDNTLKMVHIVFRHGSRTGSASFGHQNFTYPPYGRGHLINKGKKEIYESGIFLRQRYGSFLGKNYVPEEIYAEGTSKYRVYMSIALLLAGLFPPKNTDLNWSDTLNWQPIPIHTRKLTDLNNLLLQYYSCPRVMEAIYPLVIKHLEIIRATDKEISLEQLEKDWGDKITTPQTIANIYRRLKTYEDYGLPLPNWSKNYYPDILERILNDLTMTTTQTEELQRLQAGPLLKKLISDWLAKIENSLISKERKLFIYGGHDVTIVNLLHSLQIWHEKFPYYGVMAIFELVQNNKSGKYGIQIYVRNLPNNDLKPLIIPNCHTHFCPIERFIEITNNLTRYDLINDCKLDDSSFQNPLNLHCNGIFSA